MVQTNRPGNVATGIAKAVRIAGGQAALAIRLNELGDEKVTQQAVSLWVRQGFVPPQRALPVSESVAWRVPPVELLAPELKAILVSMMSPAIAAARRPEQSVA